MELYLTMRFFLLVTLASFSFITEVVSQNEQFTDTIYFMNGDVLRCEILDDSQIDVVFKYQPRKKLREKSVHKSEIFGVINDGEEIIYYLENGIVGDDLTEAEVKVFLAGERDARKNYNTKGVFYVGLVSNMAISALGEAGLLAVTIPVIVYPAMQYIPFIKIKEETITDITHRFNDIYAEGYEGVARGKRVMAALKSSALGTVLGVLIHVIILR